MLRTSSQKKPFWKAKRKTTIKLKSFESDSSTVLRKPRKAIGEITKEGISLITIPFAPNCLRFFLNKSNSLLATTPATIEMNDPINNGGFVSLPSSDLLSVEFDWAMAVGKRRATSLTERLA